MSAANGTRTTHSNTSGFLNNQLTVSNLIAAAKIPTDHTGAIYIIEAKTSYFSKAMTMMSKIGDHIYLVPATEGLYMKSCNNSRTACGGFLFRNQFFMFVDTSKLSASRNTNLCRISVKCALSTFNNIGERKPCQSLLLYLDPTADTMKVICFVNCDVVKTHILRLSDPATTYKLLGDDDGKSLMPNVIRGPPGYFTKVLGNYGSPYDTLIDCRVNDRIYFRRFLPPEDDRTRIMKREGYIPANDLLKYVVNNKTEVSISTKEFMALLQYADATCIPIIDLCFDEPGKPLIVTIEETPDEFSAEFHISTMMGDGDELGPGVSSLNYSNASLCASQLNIAANARQANVPKTPLSKVITRKRKSPVAVAESISRLPKTEQSLPAPFIDSFEEDDDEFLASVAEYSERYRLTQTQGLHHTRGTVAANEDLEDAADSERHGLSQHTPNQSRHDSLATGQTRVLTQQNQYNSNVKIDATMNKIPKYERVQTYGTPTPDANASSVLVEDSAINGDQDDMFDIDQNYQNDGGALDQFVGNDNDNQADQEMEVDDHDKTPPPVEEDDDDGFLPASPEPPSPLSRYRSSLKSNHSHRQDSSVVVDSFQPTPIEKDARDTTPPPEDDDDGFMAASPSPPPPPLIRRRHFLNSSQPTQYGTPNESRVLAHCTQRPSQLEKSDR